MDGLDEGGRFEVTKKGDEEGKHAECWFYVLDIRHDMHARTALRAYRNSCYSDFPQLSADITRKLNEYPYEGPRG